MVIRPRVRADTSKRWPNQTNRSTRTAGKRFRPPPAGSRRWLWFMPSRRTRARRRAVDALDDPAPEGRRCATCSSAAPRRSRPSPPRSPTPKAATRCRRTGHQDHRRGPRRDRRPARVSRRGSATRPRNSIAHSTVRFDHAFDQAQSCRDRGWRIVGEVDHELRSMGREQVLTHQHRAAAVSVVTRRHFRIGAPTGTASSSASSGSAESAPIVCVAPRNWTRATRRTVAARRRHRQVLTELGRAPHGHDRNGSPSARLMRLTRSTAIEPRLGGDVRRRRDERELDHAGPLRDRLSSRLIVTSRSSRCRTGSVATNHPNPGGRRSPFVTHISSARRTVTRLASNSAESSDSLGNTVPGGAAAHAAELVGDLLIPDRTPPSSVSTARGLCRIHQLVL